MTGPHGERRDESGTITVFVLGLTAIAILLVVGAVAVTSAHIARMRLLDTADAAALAAANALDESAYAEGVGDALPLSDASVRQRAAQYLAATERPSTVTTWGLAPGTGSPDGRTAVVALTGEAELPMVGGPLRDLGVSVTISVVSSARSDVVQP